MHEHTLLQLRGLNRGEEEGEQPLKGVGTEEPGSGLQPRAPCNPYPLQAMFDPCMQRSLILYALLKRPWFTCYLINIVSPCPSDHPPNAWPMPGTKRDALGALAVKEQSGEKSFVKSS